MNITTLDMEIALMNYFGVMRNVIVPTITNLSGLTDFEIDLLVLNNNSFATAVEIKISKSDLKADKKKAHIKAFDSDDYKFYFRNFKHFYYAVPYFLKDVALEQIPKEAGLLLVRRFPNEDRLYVYVKRKPKLLNNVKWSDESRYKLARLGAIRILKLKRKLNIQYKLKGL